MDLVRSTLYRIAHNADNPELRGKPVVFLEYVDRPSFDIRRARVALLDDNGSGYLVNPSIVIPL